LTALSLALFVLLSAIFADGLFAPPLWIGDDWINSPLITYLMMAAIVAGWTQAHAIPDHGTMLQLEAAQRMPGQVNDPITCRLLMGNVNVALLWLPLRFFVGRTWIAAGAHKLADPGWMQGGDALQHFWAKQVIVPTQGQPPIAYDWFRGALQFMLAHGWYSWFAKLIALSETMVGLGLIVGAVVGLAAFFGAFMNFNYLLAGTTSANPVLFGAGMMLVFAWKVAGYWGLDRWLLTGAATRRESARARAGRLVPRPKPEAVA
jgi:thiosulfate dehydrogenase [quinone] large subunit